MIITIEDADYKVNMVVTRTDSAQVQKHIQLHPNNMKITTSENALLQTLKPYFDDDWKLVSNMAERNPTTHIALYRFFLSKDVRKD